MLCSHRHKNAGQLAPTCLQNDRVNVHKSSRAVSSRAAPAHFPIVSQHGVWSGPARFEWQCERKLGATVPEFLNTPSFRTVKHVCPYVQQRPGC